MEYILGQKWLSLKLLKLILELCRLILEPWRITLEPWKLCTWIIVIHPGDAEGQLGDIELHFRTVEGYLGAVEAHPGAWRLTLEP